MAIQYGEYEDGEPELESGKLVATSKAAWLIVEENSEQDELLLQKIDDLPGRVRIHGEDLDEEITYTEQRYDTFQMARLAFGLWDRCGPFVQPEGDAIPVEVATDGQAAIAAYLRVGNGYPMSRTGVASRMGVTPETVSNYCATVRWSP